MEEEVVRMTDKLVEDKWSRDGHGMESRSLDNSSWAPLQIFKNPKLTQDSPSTALVPRPHRQT